MIDSAETPSLMAWMNFRIALDCGELLATVRQIGAVLHAQPIQLAHVIAAEVFKQVAPHQLVPQCHEDALFHLLAADG